MAVCGVSIGREISFIRNNLKRFHSCLTHIPTDAGRKLNVNKTFRTQRCFYFTEGKGHLIQV